MDEKAICKPISSLHSRLTLMIFILTFAVGLFCAAQAIITGRSMMLNSAYDSALNEHFRIGYSIKQMAESNNFTREEEDLLLLGTMRNSIEDYSKYCDENTSYRISTDEEGVIYTNLSNETANLFSLSPPKDGTVNYTLAQSADHTMVFVTSYIKVYHRLLRLDYVQDISYIRHSLRSLASNTALALFLTETVLFITLWLIIRNFLKPLSILQRQALSIADGEYEKRAEVVHNDEVGQLAISVNKMSEAVEKHVHALSEAAELKELFAANLAHEMKTPLTSIVAYSDYAVKKELDGESLYGVLENIKKEAQRISALSDKVLKWSDLNSGGLIEIKTCRTERIINQILHTLNPIAEKRSIKIAVQNDTEIIYADETLLISLILNLCTNAINASRDGERIELTLSNYDMSGLIIKVRDYGVGIATDEMSRITEPFYMVDKSRNRAKGGSGLGLPFCISIVTAHCGSMDIESILGEGTNITVIIPQKATAK